MNLIKQFVTKLKVAQRRVDNTVLGIIFEVCKSNEQIREQTKIQQHY